MRRQFSSGVPELRYARLVAADNASLRQRVRELTNDNREQHEKLTAAGPTSGSSTAASRHSRPSWLTRNFADLLVTRSLKRCQLAAAG